jgi:hypothetical protein
MRTAPRRATLNGPRSWTITVLGHCQGAVLAMLALAHRGNRRGDPDSLTRPPAQVYSRDLLCLERALSSR